MIDLLVYLVLINAASLFIMLVDKIRARKNFWRVPEALLLGICAIGGSLGGLMGMKLFRHKTRHPQFSVGIPVMLALHIVLLVMLWAR